MVTTKPMLTNYLTRCFIILQKIRQLIQYTRVLGQMTNVVVHLISIIQQSKVIFCTNTCKEDFHYIEIVYVMKLKKLVQPLKVQYGGDGKALIVQPLEGEGFGWHNVHVGDELWKVSDHVFTIVDPCLNLGNTNDSNNQKIVAY